MKLIWDEEKINILREVYPNSSWEVIFEKIGTNSRTAIQSKASKLNIKRVYKNEDLNKKFSRTKLTDLEKDFIINNYSNMRAVDISNNLEVSLNSVYSFATKNNLKRTHWKKEDIDLLTEAYPHYANKYISENYFIDKNPSAIRKMALGLGLRKSEEKGCFWYDKDEMLYKLHHLSELLGRCPEIIDLQSRDMPSEVTYRRYFGSFSKACIKCGLTPVAKTFGKNIGCLSDNGDKCDSNAERVITNYMINNNIQYNKEVRYSDYIKDDRCFTKTTDWVVNGVFIEYFGMMSMDSYCKKTELKISILKDNNIPYVDLYPEDLKNLDTKLKILSQ